jgi:hypothetical protein
LLFKSEPYSPSFNRMAAINPKVNETASDQSIINSAGFNTVTTPNPIKIRKIEANKIVTDPGLYGCCELPEWSWINIRSFEDEDFIGVYIPANNDPALTRVN